jgi:hypothetical protein
MPDGRKRPHWSRHHWWDSDDVRVATSVLEDLVHQIGVKQAGRRSIIGPPDDDEPRLVIDGEFGCWPAGTAVVTDDVSRYPVEGIPATRNRSTPSAISRFASYDIRRR